MTMRKRSIAVLVSLLALATFGLATYTQNRASAQERQATSQSSRAISMRREVRRERDREREREFREFARRGDIRPLPPLLKARLIEIAARPHTFLPSTLFSEADDPSQLFQYYLLDTNNFQPNVFTSVIPGINDTAIPTAANAANGGLPTIGAVRIALEPKEGLPTDPNDPGAFIDIFMDFSGLFVINNESGWYEG